MCELIKIKVTLSRAQCKSGTISETVQDLRCYYRPPTDIIYGLCNSVISDNLDLMTGGHRRRPNVALVFWVILCCSVFCYGCRFAFVVFDLVFFSVLSQEIRW